MSNGFFVTATSTGVGKTVFSALFCRKLLKNGATVAYYKPVQAGVVSEGSRKVAPDCRFVENSLQGAQGWESRCSYLLNLAASPHLAARKQGQWISLEVIAGTYADLAARYDFVVVEGAGGLYVPLDEEGTLIAAIPALLQIKVVLIAAAGLGTINHTALSCYFAAARGLKIAAVILIGEEANGQFSEIEIENRHVLCKLTGIKEIYLIPRVQGVDVDLNQTDGLKEWQGHLPDKRVIGSWAHA